MTTNGAWLALLTAFGLLTNAAQGAVVSYAFSGDVTSVLGDGDIAQSDKFQGVFTYDTVATDMTGSALEGTYAWVAAPYGLSFSTDTGLSFGSVDFFDVHVNPAAAYGYDRAWIGGTNVSRDIDLNPMSQLQSVIYLDGKPNTSAWLGNSDRPPAFLPGPNDPLTANIKFAYSVADYSAQGGLQSPRFAFEGVITELTRLGVADSSTVPADSSSPVHAGGGAQAVGGIDAAINATTAGVFSSSYFAVSPNDLPDDKAFAPGTFSLGIPGTALQYWDLTYTGAFDTPATLTFGFDPRLVPNPSNVGIWHYNHSNTWEYLGGTLFGNSITIETDSFSPFALALAPNSSPGSAETPEPTSVLAWAGFAVFGLFARRQGICRRARKQKA
jgi:hypothetical protein